ncbi:SH3 domain-binding protein 5-like, partial [Sarcoptes scabiei]
HLSVILKQTSYLSIMDDPQGILLNTDPRVQVELENLNTSNEFINKLEFELEKARNEFNNLLSDSVIKIEALSKKLSRSISKARPYYEAKAEADELHLKAQKEACRFEQATIDHCNAKEINQSIELALNNNNDCDTQLERLLTKSAEDVNRAELERSAAEYNHRITSTKFSQTEEKLSKLHNQLKRSIVKASMETRRNYLEFNNYANQQRIQLLPYFEMKIQFNQMLEEQIEKIHSYEIRVNKAKQNYTKTLERLDELNNQIYEKDHLRNGSNEPYSFLSSKDSIDDIRQDHHTIHDDANTRNVFDHTILDNLILNDDIDVNLNRLRFELKQNDRNQCENSSSQNH